MSAPLTIWLLNPYHAGSHRAWAEGYARHSRHRVRVLAMAGAFWKWRMQGAALELAAQAHDWLAAGERPAVLLATSMTNVPAFLALTRRALGHVPLVLYMHENQLTYPLPPGHKRDLAYGMIQHLSMLAADRVCFNSAYHLRSWFAELPRLLKHFPDYVHLESIQTVRAKAQVLPVGCDLQRLDHYSADAHTARSAIVDKIAKSGPSGRSASAIISAGRAARSGSQQTPLILWNQRWEYDKDPETLLAALYTLVDERIPFRVALAGENFRVAPTEFTQAAARLGERLVHFGYVEDQAAYARLLWSADVVLSTAIHEFFGVGVAEAIYCGAHPVLPERLSYPELLPPELHPQCLYHDFAGLLALLRAALAEPRAAPALRAWTARFDWAVQGPIYDALMTEVAAGGSSGGQPRVAGAGS